MALSCLWHLHARVIWWTTRRSQVIYQITRACKCHRPQKAIVQLTCTMIEYLPVSYNVLVSSPNGLAVMANDFRTLDRGFDIHSVFKKKASLLLWLGLFLKKKNLSSRKLVNGRYSSGWRIVWSLSSTSINQPCRCITYSPVVRQ